MTEDFVKKVKINKVEKPVRPYTARLIRIRSVSEPRLISKDPKRPQT